MWILGCSRLEEKRSMVKELIGELKYKSFQTKKELSELGEAAVEPLIWKKNNYPKAYCKEPKMSLFIPRYFSGKPNFLEHKFSSTVGGGVNIRLN